MRYLLIDRIDHLEPGQRASGIKCVSLSSDLFDEHFPGEPVWPGALLIESMAQLAGALLEESAIADGNKASLAILATVHKAKFRRSIRPGDQIVLSAEVVSRKPEIAKVCVSARIVGEPAGEAELGFAINQDARSEIVAARREVRRRWLGKSP